MALLYEFEYIHLYQLHINSQFFTHGVDEATHLHIFFNNGLVCSTSAGQFICNTSRAAKQIQRFYTFQFYIILNNVEESFFGNISGGPCIRHVCRWLKKSSSKFAAYDTHVRIRSINCLV